MSSAWKGISIIMIWVVLGAITIMMAIYAKEFLALIFFLGFMALLATFVVVDD